MHHSMDQKSPKVAKSDNINVTQAFKVTLLKNDSEWSDLFEKIEVRRFVVPQDFISLVYIKEKIRSLFVNQIENGVHLKIHWRDKDGDFIRIRSDEELLIGLRASQFVNQELDSIQESVFNLSVVAGKVIIEKSRGGRFLWDRN